MNGQWLPYSKKEQEKALRKDYPVIPGCTMNQTVEVNDIQTENHDIKAAKGDIFHSIVVQSVTNSKVSESDEETVVQTN